MSSVFEFESLWRVDKVRQRTKRSAADSDSKSIMV